MLIHFIERRTKGTVRGAQCTLLSGQIEWAGNMGIVCDSALMTTNLQLKGLACGSSAGRWRSSWCCRAERLSCRLAEGLASTEEKEPDLKS